MRLYRCLRSFGSVRSYGATRVARPRIRCSARRRAVVELGARPKRLSENRLGEGDSPILLRAVSLYAGRKIGTAPDGSRIGSKAGLVVGLLVAALLAAGGWQSVASAQQFFRRSPSQQPATGNSTRGTNAAPGSAATNTPAATTAAAGSSAANAGAGNAAPANGAPGPAAKPAAGAPAKAAAPQQPQLRVVATVNREEISRDDLGKDCVAHYGNEVLEGLVSKQLIIEHCERMHVTVTTKEVADEIDRLARKFSLPTDQWLRLLEKERGVKPRQYANDVIWPMLALRKVAAAQLVVSKAEIDQGFESEFGPAVKARMIAVADPKKAAKVFAEARSRPDDFGTVARKYSEDPSSASANGLVQPIRRFMGEKALEDAAFALRDGEISPPVTIGGMQVILKCEGRVPATQVDRSQVDKMLEEALRERKLRAAGMALFKALREKSVIEEVYADPIKRKQWPGVAAIVNGRQITMTELSDECIERHGIEVLEGAINRRLVEQSLRKANKKVTQQEIDAEIARAAMSMGKLKRPGEPDIGGWLDFVTKEQGITVDIYVRDQVWPSVALKKVVEAPPVTDEDLKKGFEANFGPRVKCRAIVLSNQRKAQDVWEKARENPTAEFFGKLAEEYSVESTSRALKGEVPPIQRYGGQPQLEKEAFSLEPGEISAIIQTGATYVILFCEGRTKPDKIDFREVRDEILLDIQEKKLRMAMAKKFEEIHESSVVDNFLTGTMHTPKGVEQKMADIKQASHVERAGKPAGHDGPTVRDPDKTTLDDLMKQDRLP